MKKFKNRKAARDFFFTEDLEVGIVLKGTEIKSIRAGKLSFKDSYADIVDDEVWLYNMHITPYAKGNYFNHKPERKRKLLLKKKEIKKLKKKVQERGYTLIPRELYINEDGLAKIVLALAKGKKLYDKRETLKKRSHMREIEREKKQKNW